MPGVLLFNGTTKLILSRDAEDTMDRKHRKTRKTGQDTSSTMSATQEDKGQDMSSTSKDRVIRSSALWDTEDMSLWWVQLLQDWARPAVALVVLVMSFPGEHYLAHMAGWSKELSWGMPIVLTLYAGVAAVVATKRPRGASGKKTAVLGAGIAIVLSMAAQPFAHLFQSGWRPGDAWTYRQTEIVVVSCIPALVFGHLLHLAAAPIAVVRGLKDRLSRKDNDASDTVSTPVSLHDVPAPRDTRPIRVPDTLSPVSTPAPLPVSPVSLPKKDTVTVPVPDTEGQQDTVHPVRQDTVPPAQVVRDIQTGSVSSVVLQYLQAHGADVPRQGVTDFVRDHFTGQGRDVPKDAAINKAITRGRERLRKSA